jgi:MerR family mercuric resistance operon transcriptional regulator
MRPNTISRLAARSGVHVETVRFYERRGLLDRPEKPARGWREYKEEAIFRLHYIREAQALGFSLAEIKALLSTLRDEPAFCLGLRRAAEEKLVEVRKRMEALAERERGLAAFLAQCGAKRDEDRCPIAKRLIGQGGEPES